MAGRQAIGAKFAGKGDEVDELHPLVAQRAGDRRAATGIFIGEAIDHPGAETAFVIEHIMGDAEPVANGLRVVDVLPGATAAAALCCLAMIVELERDADNFGAGVGGECRDDRTVDPARHGDDDARVGGRPGQVEIDRGAGGHVEPLPDVHPVGLAKGNEGRFAGRREKNIVATGG